MKRFIPFVLLAVLCGAVMTYAAGLFRTARASVAVTTSVTTNAAATDLTGGRGEQAVFIHLINSSGTETVSVATVSGHTHGSGLTTINPGGSITFPSTTYQFIPNALYAKGNTADKTNSLICVVGLE